MRRSALLLLLLALSAGVVRGDDDDPKEFLAGARKAHLDLVARGLRSFSARLSLRRSGDVDMRRLKHLAGFGYSFSAPATEEFDFAETHQSLQKPLRDVVRNSWRDVTGALWFDLFDRASGLAIERGEAFTVVSGEVPSVGEVRASFERDSRKLVEIEFPKAKAKFGYLYERTEGGLRVTRRELSVGDAVLCRTTYAVFREVSGFELPTVLKLLSKRNATEYAIEYRTLNGEPAVLAEMDAAVVKARVSEFEEGWRDWSVSERIGRMQELAEIPDDLASAAIAVRGLKDRSPDVREQAAEVLGVMKRGNVVPALVAALKKNEDEIEVYLRVIEALGEIGDPRAVDALSKDWWSQRVGEHGVAAAKARIHALGNIRHASSVDALLDAFTVAKEETVALFKADLVVALKKLTGQDFGYDRRAWKEWWKKNRSRHRFD